ncbi:hypothetical protein [Phenylobacterium sp. SCN 70-31]|uniref:hypothetical protein n=1 Tax=Phenylobacterium sp. SCN 70-31 TaxID=1660129 RepID=UPI000869B075|nr:hypothetical protein [Phenylobacterium sp. SCN 70-31]ODT89195.1 MAG: hypothetical protein ABS78_03120 [Phenylobacterium sp. SCN 70-31]
MAGAEPPQVFLVTLEAVEAPGDVPLTVLAFARAGDEAAAQAAAVAELEGFGWRDIRPLRVGELIDRDALPDDFRDAVANADRFGCGLIVYDEP